VTSAVKAVAEDLKDDNMSFEDFKKTEYFKDCNGIDQAIFATMKENAESSVRGTGTDK